MTELSVYKWEYEELLIKIMDWIGSTEVLPEQVFEEDALMDWALAAGWTPPEEEEQP